MRAEGSAGDPLTVSELDRWEETGPRRAGVCGLPHGVTDIEEGVAWTPCSTKRRYPIRRAHPGAKR